MLIFLLLLKLFFSTQGVGKKGSKRLIRYLLHLSQVRTARIQPGYDTILSASGPNMNVRNNESASLQCGVNEEQRYGLGMWETAWGKNA